jgi:hypothetical protein
VVNDEEEREESPERKQKLKELEEEGLARKKRMEELGLRIGQTNAGYEWLRRVERI